MPAPAQILGLTVTDALLDLDARLTLDGGRITVLDGRVTAATNAVARLDSQVQTLSTTVSTNANAISTLNAQTMANATQMTALDARVTAQGGVLGALQSADVAITSQVAVQAGALTTLDGRLAVQEAAGVAIGTRVTTAEAGLTKQVADLAAVDVRVTANTGAIAGVNGRIDSVAADVTALGGRVGIAETTIAANTQALVGLDVRVNDNSSAIARERTRNDQQDGQLAAQSTRIDAVGAVANTALADTQALRSDVTAGRVGIVQVGANEAITVGAAMGGASVSVAGTAGTRRISGVSAGSQADDVATVGQVAGAMASTLGAANLYTDRSILRALDQQMGTTRTLIAENNGMLRREINGAAANGAALAGLPQSMIPGKGFAGVSMGGKGGELAIALGASKAFDGEHAPILRAGAAIDTRRGDLTYNAGVGFHF